jgi:iron(III) transport system substrate-binding protein
VRRIVGSLVLLLVLVACGDGAAESGSEGGRPSLTVYSGREEELVAPLLARFEKDEGIDLQVRYGDSAELASTILEEGSRSPADVFFSQDAGALGVVAESGLLSRLDDSILERVDAQFRSEDGYWVGTSGRARVAAYNTEAVDEGELPASIAGFTAPEWKGRVGFPPSNSSFQAFVAAMIETSGTGPTKEFLEGLVANDAKSFYEENSDVVRAVADGEIDVGFVNHYYIYEVEAEDGDIPVANHFFTNGDPGALVNAAGVGVLASSDEAQGAATFVDYLTGDEGQRYFAEDTFEYPVTDGLEPSVELKTLDEIQSPDIDLSDLGARLEEALRLLAEVGLL